MTHTQADVLREYNYDTGMKNPHHCARVADNNDFEDVSNA